MFALALDKPLKRIQRSHPQICVLAYLDDTYLVGQAQHISAAVKDLETDLARINLKLNSDKTQIYTNGCNISDITAHMGPTFHRISQEGIIVVGIPVGTTEYKKHTLDNKLSEIRAFLDNVNQIPTVQVRLHMLRTTVIPALNNIFRTIPPHITKPYAEQFDRYITNSLCLLLKTKKIEKHVQLQASLPLSKGGLGLTTIADKVQYFYLAAWCMTLKHSVAIAARRHSPIQKNWFSHHIYNPTSTISNIITSFKQHFPMYSSQLPDITPTTPLSHVLSVLPKKLQHVLTAACHEERHQELYSLVRGEREQKRILTVASQDASAWLRAIPSQPGFKIDNELMVLRLRRWLGMAPLLRPHKCFCGKNISDDRALHLETCGNGIRVHDNIVADLSKMVNSAGGRCQREVPATVVFPQVSADCDYRVDLFMEEVDGAATVGDVTIRHQASYQGDPHSAAHSSKQSKYGELCRQEGYSLDTLSLTYHGSLSASLASLIQNMGKLRERGGPPFQAANWSASTFTSFWKQKISCSLQRGLAMKELVRVQDSFRRWGFGLERGVGVCGGGWHRVQQGA